MLYFKTVTNILFYPKKITTILFHKKIKFYVLVAKKKKKEPMFQRQDKSFNFYFSQNNCEIFWKRLVDGDSRQVTRYTVEN